MFTFIIQTIDLVKLGNVGLFFTFFLLSWAFHLFRLFISQTRNPLDGVWLLPENKIKDLDVTFIIPVADEPFTVWVDTMEALDESLSVFKSAQVIVVANGFNGQTNLDFAEKLGFTIVELPNASKRMAVHEGAKLATGSITFILDSDTKVNPNAMEQLTRVFSTPDVGGATPKHIIDKPNSSYIKKVSSWLEDTRFEEIVRGQSSYGTVSCLPGRLLAIRTDLLKELTPKLIKQKFLGAECISGDDRYLTSELLKMGYKTVYQPTAEVVTQAPNTLKGFILQRLRWSRTSFRETLRSIPWTFKYPFLTLTVLGTVLLRWLFFVVILTAILAWIGLIDRDHAVDLPFWFIVVGSFVGYVISGILRQLRYIIKNPGDLKFIVYFLFVTTFILTPVEWFGNITIRESHWMTRKTK